MSEQNAQLTALSEAGVSVWLDDLSRERLRTGNLAELIATRSVVGVTTNPSIFQAALSDGASYETQIAELVSRGADTEAVITALTTDDVREACDLFAPIYQSSEGADGRVSIEVDPRLAHDTEGTIAQALELHKIVDRPNVLIKIPATKAGLPAITKVISEGVSVNVTLIFSVERHAEVIEAYIQGLHDALSAGHDLSTIHSVASFFISRVDTEVDERLKKIGTDAASALIGKTALANGVLAYELFQQKFSSDEFAELKAAGGNPQRALWASTGTKNPAFSDTLYVSDLVAPHTVNTMPEKTLQAFADHGEVHLHSVVSQVQEAHDTFAELSQVGIDLDDVFSVLEKEGVDKFISSWQELLDATTAQLESLRG